MTSSTQEKKSLASRKQACSNPIAKELFTIMEEKQTNLCHNPDVTSSSQLLELIDAVGPEVAMIKTHIDIVEDFTPELPLKLIELSKKHRFYLFEDRKFADIGTIAKLQYSSGMYRIADWAHITNAHGLPGPGVITGLQEGAGSHPRGLLLLAEMSSTGQLADERYREKTLEMARTHSDFVIGFICQKKVCEDPQFLHITPGVKRQIGGDAHGQNYRTPKMAIQEDGCDIIIVGRGISSAADPSSEARLYREEAWNLYHK